MARPQASPAVILALIVCVLLTILFTILVLVRTSGVKRQLEGDPENKAFKKIDDLKKDLKESTDRVAKFKDEIALREGELYRVELEANKKRLVHDGDKVLSGVATPNELKDAAGKDLKKSPWQMAALQVNANNARLSSLKTEYESPARQSFPELSDAIEKRNTETQAVLKKSSDLDAAFKADKEKLDAQFEALTKEKDAVEKLAREDDSRRKSKIAQLEDRIRELLELELRFVTELEPAGDVLEVDSTSGRVVIGMGSVDRVVPGLLFAVFTYDRGRFQEKGMVEVVEVQERIAICRTLSVQDNKRTPFSKGDRLGNPMFNPRRPKVFVFAGEFAHYNQSDLADFVRRTGGVVREQLGPGCDFLVVRGDEKDRSDRERALAREYQILAMKEDMLLKFVQKTFSPKEK